MCVKLDYDIASSSVLHPKDLREAHDREARRMKLKADAQLRRDFKTAMRAISGWLDFEVGGIRMLLPASAEKVIQVRGLQNSPATPAPVVGFATKNHGSPVRTGWKSRIICSKLK